MAMMDNADFLISHIRNSYITSDDTGMCEMIIESEETEKPQGDKRPISWHAHSNQVQLDSSFSDSGFEHSDNELSHSYDILPDMDYGAHRRRSNTAQRLERMKKEKRGQVKAKHITWKDVPPDCNSADQGHLFEKKDLPTESPPVEGTSPKKSLLSDLLENFNSTSDNPFMDYAKYDGREMVLLKADCSSYHGYTKNISLRILSPPEDTFTHPLEFIFIQLKANLGAGVKKIDIFLTMAPPRDRPYPMTVVVLPSAKVHDLVGLICWQYTGEAREPKLFENRECYGLHIAEDDGEVDMDFPSLDNREPVSKFGFGKLALVEKSPPPPRSPSTSCRVVTINIPNKGFSKIPVEDLNITLKELMEKVLKKRKIKLRPGMYYNLEKQSEPGNSLDLESILDNVNTLEFCLVRQHSSRGDQEAQATFDTSTVALSSHQYKSYMVEMVHKLRTNTEVQLGISGEKVEIDPVTRKGAGRIFRQKPITYDAEIVAACEKVEEKSTGKTVFRMTYFAGHEYKNQDFEANTEMAEEIVLKLNNILELRLSTVRKDYLTTKKRQHKKRESFR